MDGPPIPWVLKANEALYKDLTTFSQTVLEERLELALDTDEILVQLKFWHTQVADAVAHGAVSIPDGEWRSVLIESFADAMDLVERLKIALRDGLEELCAFSSPDDECSQLTLHRLLSYGEDLRATIQCITDLSNDTLLCLDEPRRLKAQRLASQSSANIRARGNLMHVQPVLAYYALVPKSKPVTDLDVSDYMAIAKDMNSGGSHADPREGWDLFDNAALMPQRAQSLPAPAASAQLQIVSQPASATPL